MELKLKIYLVDKQDEKFMGIGVLWLLQEIAKEGSIRRGASNLGISYSKAYHMMRTLESDIGQKVLERRKGGDARYGAVITPFGERLIAIYDEFQQDVKKYANTRFDGFKDMLHKELGDAEE